MRFQHMIYQRSLRFKMMNLLIHFSIYKHIYKNYHNYMFLLITRLLYFDPNTSSPPSYTIEVFVYVVVESTSHISPFIHPPGLRK